MSRIGIKPIALPAGVVTAGYLEEMRIPDGKKNEKTDQFCD